MRTVLRRWVINAQTLASRRWSSACARRVLAWIASAAAHRVRRLGYSRESLVRLLDASDGL